MIRWTAAGIGASRRVTLHRARRSLHIVYLLLREIKAYRTDDYRHRCISSVEISTDSFDELPITVVDIAKSPRTHLQKQLSGETNTLDLFTW